MPDAKKTELEELADFHENVGHASRETWLSQIKEAILLGQPDLAMGIAAHAMDDGISPDDIVEEPMTSGMKEVGAAFKNGRFFIPEIIMSTRAVNAVLFEIRKRYPGRGNDPKMPTVLIGTVKGDFHDVGKNLAAIMFEARGFHVIDLGVNVPAEEFVRAVREHHPDVLGLSAMLTMTVGELGTVIEALEKAGLRDGLAVYVSGVPVTQKLADEIGADRHCEDLGDSLDYLEEFVPD